MGADLKMLAPREAEVSDTSLGSDRKVMETPELFLFKEHTHTHTHTHT